jgi:endonuclease/exonuclease/phosphatase (EEP) superfamily protein YafD
MFGDRQNSLVMRARAKWVKPATLGVSALLCAAASLCYGLRPDSCAAVTFWPAWAWPAMGLVLAALGASRAGKRAAVAVVLLWLLFSALFVDEAASLLHPRRLPAAGWQMAGKARVGLRVISFNCAGSPQAAAEVAAYRPDLVLLQESPGQEQVKKLARRIFAGGGEVVSGLGGSILVRGTARLVPLRPAVDLMRAHVRLSSGVEAEIINVHLTPPVVRYDLWSPACWREHAENRRTHRREMLDIAEQAALVPAATPLIVAGDFNAPAGDAIFHLLRPRLHDAFREAGIGWGDTVLNEFAVSRIDEVWVSGRLLAASVAARRTRHSDHRMVICDLVLRDSRAR